MRSGAQSSQLTCHRPADAWIIRLTRSPSFAWIVSLAVHAIVFAILYVTVFREAIGPERVIIPEARLTPALAAETDPPTTPLRLVTEPVAERTSVTRAELAELPLAVVDLNAPPEFTRPGYDDAGPAASLASAAMSGPTGDGPTSRFFGQTGNAYRVVYVVDLSASLMEYIRDIVHQMQRSVRDLVPTQSFAIVLARPNRVVDEFRPGRLVRANRTHKQEAVRFLEEQIGPQQAGPADPVRAMQQALALRPELIYFLSDGAYDRQQKEFLATLKRLNPDQAVKITTIGFDPSPRREGVFMSPQQLLRHIAAEHGGNYREVRPTE